MTESTATSTPAPIQGFSGRRLPEKEMRTGSSTRS